MASMKCRPIIFTLSLPYWNAEITGRCWRASSLATKASVAIQIPLPPLEVQGEIVAEIEGYQRVIDGARAVIDNYRPQIVVDPEWPILSDACEQNGTFFNTPRNNFLKRW